MNPEKRSKLTLEQENLPPQLSTVAVALHLPQIKVLLNEYVQGRMCEEWMYYPGSLIYFYFNGEIISEIIPAFCNEILAGKSEMRWSPNEHLAESVLI